ncbi:NADH-quinone oxidoreductase subunit NuoE family protein [Pontiella sulfatireligans]|uniref:NADP-reducing hydrogenase subunit HndA n=1 Tax=Pontiella sulfatireligans TaxID=2750658 RepID=A0A6C2UF88_9BACT|nr:NAD(P)H-dependent oxidoreductase subunit E [Pontiella sulfatireligans]VGO18882.1 NADP-reducing hydrogenase subunit HndA [Pontiella sulfatireligans]
MTAVAENEKILTPEIDAFIAKWIDKPGNLIMVLHRVQEEFGYIPRQAAFEVAAALDIPVAKIYGVITFYHFFKLTKPGKNRIAVCMGTACYLKGGQNLIDECERKLGVGLNTVTEDGEFSVEAVRCIGCCGLAPVVTVNGEVFGGVSNKQMVKIIEQFEDK